MHRWASLILLAACAHHAVAQDALSPTAAPTAATTASAPAAVAASVAQQRKFAVLSLVGDAFYYRGDRYAMPTPTFDRAALQSTNNVLEQAQPGRPRVLFPPTLSLYAAQKSLIVDGKFQPPPELDAALKEEQASHLLLITKYLANSSVKFGDDYYVKMGKLEGLGFFQNNGTRVWSTKTNETSWGYLVPYANFTVSLVDLSKSTVVAEKSVTASQLVTSIGVDGVINPWKAHTQEQNLEILKVLLQNNVAATVSKLIN